MGTYILRRALQMIPVILGTTFLISTSFRVFDDPNLHGDATQCEAADRNWSGTRAANRQTGRFNVRCP